MKRLSVLMSGLLLVGAAAPVVAAPPDPGELRATITRTEHGVPHITAPGTAGIGYGIGYAKAADRLCELAELFLAGAGELARHFGAGPTPAAPWGAVDSDARARQVIETGEVEAVLARPAPWGPEPEVRELVRGYAAGYNRFLAEGRRDPACAAAPWVRPVTELDVYRAYYQGLGDGLSRSVAATGPNQPGPARQQAPEARPARGSNGIAVGDRGTAAGRGGVLLANPHVPWRGPYAFWQARLTVPGEYDVDGAQPIAAPVPYAAYTRDTAWTNTVSAGSSHILRELTLAPGDPTSYLVDGQPERMSRHEVTVPVRQADGSLREDRRTLYRTRHGLVISAHLAGEWFSGSRLRELPWTAERAYAVTDANVGTLRGLNSPQRYLRARSARDILRALTKADGMADTNTVAVDRHGWALFAGVHAVPHVTEELAARCNTELGRQLYAEHGLPVLDGARADCALGEDENALTPGTFGPHRMPVRLRRDYVTNSNDSAWLTNAEAPLTGFPRIFGGQDSERTPRTRMGLTAIAQRLSGADGHGGPGFDLASTAALALDNRSLIGEVTGGDVVTLCRSFPGGQARTSAGALVDVRAACAALAGWDRRYELDSRGAVLFDEFWTTLARAGGPAWQVPFDAREPVRTPRGLDVTVPRVRTAFADAVAALTARGIRAEATLGEVQFVHRERKRIPLHGGPDTAGVYNLIHTRRDPGGRVLDVSDGTSFLLAVEFTGRPCPNARTLLANSQSSDPRSPHHADQTARFSAKKWLPGLLCAPGRPTAGTLRLAG